MRSLVVQLARRLIRCGSAAPVKMDTFNRENTTKPGEGFHLYHRKRSTGENGCQYQTRPGNIDRAAECLNSLPRPRAAIIAVLPCRGVHDQNDIGSPTTLTLEYSSKVEPDTCDLKGGGHPPITGGFQAGNYGTGEGANSHSVISSSKRCLNDAISRASVISLRMLT